MNFNPARPSTLSRHNFRRALGWKISAPPPGKESNPAFRSEQNFFVAHIVLRSNESHSRKPFNVECQDALF